MIAAKNTPKPLRFNMTPRRSICSKLNIIIVMKLKAATTNSATNAAVETLFQPRRAGLLPAPSCLPIPSCPHTSKPCLYACARIATWDLLIGQLQE